MTAMDMQRDPAEETPRCSITTMGLGTTAALVAQLCIATSPGSAIFVSPASRDLGQVVFSSSPSPTTEGPTERHSGEWYATTTESEDLDGHSSLEEESLRAKRILEADFHDAHARQTYLFALTEASRIVQRSNSMLELHAAMVAAREQLMAAVLEFDDWRAIAEAVHPSADDYDVPRRFVELQPVSLDGSLDLKTEADDFVSEILG